jgi:hypothetical protein
VMKGVSLLDISRRERQFADDPDGVLSL